MRKPFPCFACGKCCQRVGEQPQGMSLDRGDGVCLYFDEESKHCRIYDKRPLICRVEEYYETHLSHIYQWDEFVEMNLAVCYQLNQK